MQEIDKIRHRVYNITKIIPVGKELSNENYY